MCPVPVFCFLPPAMYQWFLPLWCPRGACLLCRLQTLPLAFDFAPIPPTPFPAGRGESRLFHARGCAPCIPAPAPEAARAEPAVQVSVGRLAFFAACNAFLPPSPRPPSRREGGDFYFISPGGYRPRHPCTEPLAALTDLAKQVPGATESLRFNAKPTERFPYKQCRQPRRGGTGGEELRRLRWSSPPGQGEQVPLGFILPPPGTTAARSAGNKEGTPSAGRVVRPPCPSVASGSAPGMQGAKPLA